MPRKKPSERAYARLTRHERQTSGRMLDRGKGCREIAREIGRAPSTVANEVERHRFVTSPRAARGARALMDAFGVEALEPGELDLTPGCVERARTERGEAPPAE